MEAEALGRSTIIEAKLGAVHMVEGSWAMAKSICRELVQSWPFFQAQGVILMI